MFFSMFFTPVNNWSVASFIFNPFVKWITSTITTAISSFLKALSTMPSISAFSDFENFASWLGVVMLVIGLVIGIAEMGVSYSRGQGNLSALFISLTKAIVFQVALITVIKQLFMLSIQAGFVGFNNAVTNVFSSFDLGTIDYAGADDASTGIGGILGAGGGAVVAVGKALATGAEAATGAGVAAGALIGMIAIAIAVLMITLKFVWLLCKDYVQFYVYMIEGELVPLSLARGSDSEANSYIMQMLKFFLSETVKIWLYGIGLSIVTTGLEKIGDGKTDFWQACVTVLIGIAFCSAFNEIPRWFGLQSSEDMSKPAVISAIGGMMHIADHIRGGAGAGAGEVTSDGSDGSDAAANTIKNSG